MPDDELSDSWEERIDEGLIDRDTAEMLYDFGYENVSDFDQTGDWSIGRDGDGTWYIEDELGIRVWEGDDENNAIVWDFYDWYEAEYGEPPEKDIDSGDTAT